MVEDHLSALCETMRILIAGHGKRLPADIGEQRHFSITMSQRGFSLAAMQYPFVRLRPSTAT
jgi:hypothetical protein